VSAFRALYCEFAATLSALIRTYINGVSTLIIDFNHLKAATAYHIMTQTIIPRPIAWALTDSGGGSYNLAPFSFFNAICSDPPLVMLSIGKKPEGELKDTRLNIIERRHLVIHIPQVDHAKAVTESSRGLPHGESELDTLELPLIKEEGWALPRLKGVPVAMDCEFYELHELGPNKQGIFYCKVNRVYVDDSAVMRDEKDRLTIDAAGTTNLAGQVGRSISREESPIS